MWKFLCLFWAIAVFAQVNDYRLTLARSLAEQGKDVEAIREYKLYLESNPNDAQSYEELARIYHNQKKYKLAVIHYQLALKHEPERYSAQEGLALAYEQGGETSRAILEWRKLATLSPSTVHRDEAEQHIQDLIKLRKKREEELLENEKKIQTMKSKKELREEKNELPFYVRKQNEESISDTGILKEFGKVAPSTSPLTKAKSMDSLGTGIQTSPVKKEDLKDYLEKEAAKVKKWDPQVFQDSLYLTVVSQYDAKKYDEALESIQRLFKKIPGHPGGYYYGGEIRYGKMEWEKARINLRSALAFPEKLPRIHYLLGKISVKQNNPNQAISHFQKFLKMGSHPDELTDAKKILKTLKPTVSVSKSDSLNTIQAMEAKTSHIFSRSIGFGWKHYFLDSNQSPNQLLQTGVREFQNGLPEKSLETFREVSLQFAGSEASDLAQLNILMLYGQLGLYQEVLNRKEQLALQFTGWDFANLLSWVEAMAKYQTGELKKAKEILERVKSHPHLGPTPAEITELQANIYTQLGDTKNALLAYRNLRNLKSSKKDKFKTDYLLGNYLLKMKENENALRYFNSAVAGCKQESYDFCPNVLLASSDLLAKLKSTKQAIQEYQYFVKKYPKHKEAPWAYYQMGNIYLAEKNIKLALENFRTVIEKYPNSYWATQAKWKEDDTIWRKEYQEVFN